jgi:hypothetical protein
VSTTILLSLIHDDKQYEIYETIRSAELHLWEDVIEIKGVAWDRCSAVGGANNVIDALDKGTWRVEVRSYGVPVAGATGEAVLERHTRHSEDGDLVTIDICLRATEPPFQLWRWMPDPTQTH